MKKALEGNKTLQKLTLDHVDIDYDYDHIFDHEYETVHKEFCRHLMIGIGLNTSLSEVCLDFKPFNWDCTIHGRLVYVSHMV